MLQGLSLAATAGNAWIANDAYFNGTNWIYTRSSTYSSNIALNPAGSGGIGFNIASAGTAGNAIAFTQAMTLFNSGGLSLGNTTDPTGSGRMIIGGASTGATGTANTTTIGFSGNQISFNQSGSSYIATTYAGSSLVFQTGASVEAARIDSSGNLLVNTTSNNVVGRTSAKLNVAAGSNDTVQLKGVNSNYLNIASWIPINSPGSGDAYHIGFGDGTSSYTERGVISTNGTGTTYGTNSDYRLKENVQPMTGALAKVVALNPVTYKWKENGLDGEGFIAHELAEICPHAVVGEKDGVKEDGSPLYQNIDTSFLVATLTAAIQELKAEFDAYKAAHP
jgi:hypothetical protein